MLFRPKFNGFVQSLVTPFNHDDGDIDEEGLKRNIEFLVSSGKIDALACLTATGECECVSDIEAERVISIVLNTVNKRLPVIVNTGKSSTKQTIKLSKYAKESGADGLLLLNPIFVRPTPEGIFAHYNEVAESVDLPIIIYDGGILRTGIDVTPELVQKLSEIPNVVGFKDMSRDISKFTHIIESTFKKKDFVVFQGWEQLLLPSLIVGGQGIISLAGHFLPNQIAAILENYKKNNLELARKAHYDILPILRLLYSVPTPVGLKYMLDLIGLHGGAVRKPLLPLSESQKSSFEMALKSLDLIR